MVVVGEGKTIGKRVVCGEGEKTLEKKWWWWWRENKRNVIVGKKKTI